MKPLVIATSLVEFMFAVMRSGSGVVTYRPNDGMYWTLYDSIQLDALIPAGVSVSYACRTAYLKALETLTTDVSKYINYQ